jgi:hypothetical protein
MSYFLSEDGFTTFPAGIKDHVLDTLVTPAKAGVQLFHRFRRPPGRRLDTGFRRYDWSEQRTVPAPVPVPDQIRDSPG